MLDHVCAGAPESGRTDRNAVMLVRVGEVFLAAQDLRDFHVMVIGDHGEVVGREAVGFSNHEIVQLVGLYGHWTENAVDQCDITRRIRQAKYRRSALCPKPFEVLRCALARLGSSERALCSL